ncbi:hypothetical protein [Hyphococcus sp.]|uniref:hypothetical protein n=1 Tax=Hyphococcus sp. TaxID=2038636 RepID=UPI003CCB7764
MAAKTLFFGFDGADHSYMDAMMAEGELPAMARLKASSRVFHFENDAAMGASNFWNAASIGAGPGHHGHYFYMQFKPNTYDIVPNHESSLPDITHFWNTLDREGYRVGVVDWHRLIAKPMKNGILLDNWLGHDPLTQTIYFPQTIAADAQKYFNGDAAAGGFACRKRETAEELKDYLGLILKRIEVKADFIAEQLRKQNWDLFIACFAEAHDVGHYYYHLDDPNHERYDAALARAVREPLRECYRRLDRAVDLLVNAAGPDANIFNLGGPGMEMLVSANHAMEEMMRRIDLGVGAPLSGAEAARETYRSIIPQKLRWKLGPLARAIRKRFANHEYARRRFFAIPHNDNSGAVRINVKGREKHGVIARGPAYKAVVQEIRDALATFKNADTGLPLVKRVVETSREFPGPYAELLPDLLVEWNREGAPRNFRKIVSDQYGEIDVADNLRTGDHNPDSFYWAPASYSGPPVTLPQHVAETVMKAVKGDDVVAPVKPERVIA